MTTLILQFHNLGWVGLAPVLWIGLCFGGTAQLVAGLLEFKTGNISVSMLLPLMVHSGFLFVCL